MKPRFKIGLIVGAIGLVMNIFVSAFIGLCGPAVSLAGGGIAGYIASQREVTGSKSDGARVGAISGAVASSLILIGQLIGGISALAFIQFSNAHTLFGNAPSLTAEPSQQLIYYLSGIGTGLCFGLIGMVLGSITGAGAGYAVTRDQPKVIFQPPIQP